MSILDTKKTIKNYLIISICAFIVSFIYELFSHGVYSNYMIFAGCAPLVLGCGFYLLNMNNNLIDKKTSHLYNSFVAIITVWMYMMGILEIFGTTNHILDYYLYFAAGFLILTIINILFTER